MYIRGRSETGKKKWKIKNIPVEICNKTTEVLIYLGNVNQLYCFMYLNKFPVLVNDYKNYTNVKPSTPKLFLQNFKLTLKVNNTLFYRCDPFPRMAITDWLSGPVTRRHLAGVGIGRIVFTSINLLHL